MTSTALVSGSFKTKACRLVVPLLVFGFMSAFGRASLAVSLTPYSSFGGGDGWLSPGEGGYAYLGTGNLERGLAFGNGHLYLVSRNGGSFVRILDPVSGGETGALDMTGIAGGTFLVNMVGVAGDGVVYAGNLTLESTGSPFRLYSWATDASTPTPIYVGDAGLPGSRLGDSLAVIGSGSSTRVVGGYGNTPVVAGNNGYSIIDPTASSATAVAFSSTPPNGGDFRLGITFVDSTHVLGTQGSSLYHSTSFSGSTGTLIASPAIPDPSGATADRLLAYTTIAGQPILAVQSIGDAHVSIYSVADPSAPVWLASGRNVSGALAANGNGTGSLTWGATTVNGDGSTSRILYGMSTNSGIQAFTVTLPVPPTVAGDYNKNGVVDGADYVLWRDTLNLAAVPAGTGADGSGNGIVGPEDYDFWRGKVGNTSGSGVGQSEAVPEPAAMSLGILAVAAVVLGFRAGRV